MPDRSDYVSRQRRHERRAQTAVAAAMAHGIEMDRIQRERSRRTDTERAADRDAAIAADRRDHDREERRARRMTRLRAVCEMCDSAPAASTVDGVGVCDACIDEMTA